MKHFILKRKQLWMSKCTPNSPGTCFFYLSQFQNDLITESKTSGGLVSSVQFSSVAQLCSTLSDPMDCSMPGLPVRHQLPEFTQTHVHRVGDAIQPFHPLSSYFPPAFNLSQQQGLFQ